MLLVAMPLLLLNVQFLILAGGTPSVPALLRQMQVCVIWTKQLAVARLQAEFRGRLHRPVQPNHEAGPLAAFAGL